MGSIIKACAVVLLLLSMTMPSDAGRVKGIRNGLNYVNPPNEVAVEKEMRKLISIEALLDYEKPGPNRGHDKGKPGSSRAGQLDRFKGLRD